MILTIILCVICGTAGLLVGAMCRAAGHADEHYFAMEKRNAGNRPQNRLHKGS